MRDTRVVPDLAADAGKLAPPAIVTGLNLFGVGLQDWVYILTIIYTLLLIFRHAWVNWIKPLLAESAAPPA
jgi:hypothetical protein